MQVWFRCYSLQRANTEVVKVSEKKDMKNEKKLLCRYDTEAFLMFVVIQRALC